MLSTEPTTDRAAARLVMAAAGLSVGLVVALVAAYWAFHSQLALAQAADSFSDVFTSAALLISLRVAMQPPDDRHPVGHHRAEPIGALLAAFMAGMLAIEVLRAAAEALLSGSTPELDVALAAVFGTKVFIKSVIAWRAHIRVRKQPSPALRALQVDARNDVAVGVLALVGYALARSGSAGWDAWFAIPIGLWIGWSGISLAFENIRLLMGEAPSIERQGELLAVVEGTAGVLSSHGLNARYHGTHLDVLVHVVVGPTLTLREAHDIGHAVEARLIAESDVCHAVAHVDLEADDEPPAL